MFEAGPGLIGKSSFLGSWGPGVLDTARLPCLHCGLAHGLAPCAFALLEEGMRVVNCGEEFQDFCSDHNGLDP
jgi:hypothetical protein